MKPRVFLDTPVFIYAFEFPESNSALLINLLNNEEIEAIISEKVLEEVTRYFNTHHPALLAKKMRRYLLNTCIFIKREDVAEQLPLLKGTIKEKDIEQLATVKRYGIKFLISYDRDFNKIEEYYTPKKFLLLFKRKARETEF